MIRSIRGFETIFYRLFVRVLGWSVSYPNNVRIGWPTGGAPAFLITDNVVFLSALPVEHQINKQHDVIIEESSPDLLISKGMTRVMSLDIVAYGSNAMENLKTIQLGMFNDIYRNELQLEDIYYVPDTVEPRRLPENFQGQWWERADMQLRFNELLTDETQVHEVESVDIEVHNKDGLLTEFTVNNL